MACRPLKGQTNTMCRIRVQKSNRNNVQAIDSQKVKQLAMFRIYSPSKSNTRINVQDMVSKQVKHKTMNRILVSRKSDKNNVLDMNLPKVNNNECARYGANKFRTRKTVRLWPPKKSTHKQCAEYGTPTSPNTMCRISVLKK